MECFSSVGSVGIFLNSFVKMLTDDSINEDDIIIVR